ncbi:methionyl-tRNA formyltransferase [Mycoplasma sp. 128]|uniref:methionyl-tRNA formyltransferase n=1 Tax=Mycoplasma sp. 3341 TaxID=3447506 RepID=UPI003F65A9D8
MKKTRVILAGTIDFSAKIFSHFINNEKYEVVAIVSQPNRQFDRKKQLLDTSTASLAKQNAIKLYQPEKIGEIYDELSSLDYDFLITAAFGQYIPEKVLKLAKIASINVHGSLLEKYRGAAPIQHALLNGDKQTGVTLIYMTKAMDAGDMIAQVCFDIEENDTALELYEKMADHTTKNIDNWLNDLIQGSNEAVVQDEAKVTWAPKIENHEAEILPADSIDKALAKIKAFNDQPGAFIVENGKRIKIFRATKKKVSTPMKISINSEWLYLIEYQIEGKKRVKQNV